MPMRSECPVVRLCFGIAAGRLLKKRAFHCCNFRSLGALSRANGTVACPERMDFPRNYGLWLVMACR
jgi:hypothetical protein